MANFQIAQWALLTKDNQRRAMQALIGLALGFIIASAGLYLTESWNNARLISDIRATAIVETREHSRWLNVTYEVGTLRRCPSWTQHTLYHMVHRPTGVLRVEVPVGITANGWGARENDTDFEKRFELPPDLSEGTWLYVAVTSSSCEWLPGLVRQQVQETAPIRVEVPPQR